MFLGPYLIKNSPPIRGKFSLTLPGKRGQIKNLIDVCLEPLEVQQQPPSIAGWGGLVDSISIPCQSGSFCG